MRNLSIISLLLLSVRGFSQIAPLSSFSKSEVKEAPGFLSAQKPVTASSKFIFASGDMKGYFKVNGKIISLEYVYAEEDEDDTTTILTDYANDQYYVLISSRVVKMGKNRDDPNTIRERSLEIKDKKTEKILFSGKVYHPEPPKEPEKYSLLDIEVIEQVLADLVGGLKKIPQTPLENKSGYSSLLKIIKESRYESGIFTDNKSYLLFSSYDFNSTPTKNAKLLKEFLELKKEIAPFEKIIC